MSVTLADVDESIVDRACWRGESISLQFGPTR